MGPYQALPLQVRVDLGVMAMKEVFYNSQKLQDWSLTIRWFSVKSGHLEERSYHTEEIQLVYSTISAKWVGAVKNDEIQQQVYIYIYIYI